MSVLIPNSKVTVRRRTAGGENSHGEDIPGAFGAAVGPPLDAFIQQRGDGGWLLSIDDSLWPTRQGDAIIDETGRVFIVETADLLTNAADSTVNYIRCECARASSIGVEPQDPYFVGRDTETVELGEPAQVLTGHGPPPSDLNVTEGTEYVDLDTGTVYQLEDV